MKNIKLMTDVHLGGRNVLMRLDLNAPIRDGVVTSDARLRAALPSIKYAIEQGAQLALASHLGRPKGKRNPDFSLEPVAERLSKLLGIDVILAPGCRGDSVRGLLGEQRPGGVVLLENLRFERGETKNDPDFARELGRPFDIYINDAFGASHREHASIVGVSRYVEEAAAGFLLEKETAALSKLVDAPAEPFVAVVGGAKVSDKLGVLNALIGRCQTICIGGAMAYTFMKAKDIKVGSSRVEEDRLFKASEVMDRARKRDTEILLPLDHVAAEDFAEDAAHQIIAGEHIPDTKMGLDIGPQTRELYASKVREAKSLFWNGPMGVFEWDAFSAGTMAIAEAARACDGYTVVGGGDSVAAAEKAGVQDALSHVSTGGGASLEFIEQNGTLPGLKVLSTN